MNKITHAPNGEIKCEGECANSDECKGEVKKVLVSGNGWIRAWHFAYCETAREVDRERGFLVQDDTDGDEYTNEDVERK
jgi:hypothetical protein